MCGRRDRPPGNSFRQRDIKQNLHTPNRQPRTGDGCVDFCPPAVLRVHRTSDAGWMAPRIRVPASLPLPLVSCPPSTSTSSRKNLLLPVFESIKNASRNRLRSDLRHVHLRSRSQPLCSPGAGRRLTCARRPRFWIKPLDVPVHRAGQRCPHHPAVHPMPRRQLPDRPPFIPIITSDTFVLLHSRSSFQAPHSSRSPWQTTRRLGTDRSRVGPIQAGTPGPLEAVTTTVRFGIGQTGADVGVAE